MSLIPFPSSPKLFPKESPSATLTAANSCVSGKDFEAVARRRFQNPKPRKIGNWWWIYPWVDVWENGQIRRKRKPIKVAPADTGARAAQRIAAEIMRGQNQGLESIGSVTPFRIFVESDYKKAVLPLLAMPVQKNYNIVLRSRLLPDFGDLPLRELTARRLQAYFVNLQGGHATKVKTRDVLASVLNAAVQFGLLTTTPLTDVRLPPNKERGRKKPTITYDEFERLVNAMAEPYSTMVYICVLAALRVSELLALKWEDVGPDFIMVDERFCRGDLSKTKTPASCAPVAVHPRVIQRIDALKQKSVTVNWGKGGAKKTFKLVRSDAPYDLVFQSLKSGGPMSDHNILVRHIKPVAKKLGLGLVNWQVLRRSYATWLIACGADPKSAQAQMRHAGPQQTLEIYAQVVSETQRRAVNTLMDDMDKKAAESSKVVPIDHQLEHFGT